MNMDVLKIGIEYKHFKRILGEREILDCSEERGQKWKDQAFDNAFSIHKEYILCICC